MNNDDKLTRVNAGFNHENNPLGGVPIGQNNSVEQNETIKNNFVYSNRLFLDENLVKQYNLPRSLVGKSIADATKVIDNKFKGRNDKISQSTKNSMLSKIAEAQESLKPQEPEVEQNNVNQEMIQEYIDPSQMAWGGFTNSQFGTGLQENATNEQMIGTIGTGLGTLSTGFELGDIAFGKSSQSTNGLNPSQSVNTGGMIANSALNGAGTGAMFGPVGAGVGALIGAGAGLLGSIKSKKAALENTNKYAKNINNQFSDQYAYGGSIKDSNILPQTIKKSINEESKLIIPDKVEKVLIKKNRNIAAYGGELKQMAEGGYYDNNKPYFMNNPGSQENWLDNVLKTKPNTAFNPVQGLIGPRSPIDKSIPITSVNQLTPATTTVPYTIGTQPTVDISNANRQITPGPSTLDILKYNAGKIGKTINDNAGNLARYAPIAMNAYQLSQLKKPQMDRLGRLDNRYKPEYVDETQLQNIADQSMNNTINAISQSGASQGQIRASILGSQLQRTKAISDAYSQAAAQNRATNDRAQQFNLGVDQVNLNQSNTEKENFARDRGNYDTQKSKLLGEIGTNIGDIGKEQVYKKIAATTTGYDWLGKYIKANPDATPAEVKDAYEKENPDKKKQSLGGYLIKNRK